MAAIIIIFMLLTWPKFFSMLNTVKQKHLPFKYSEFFSDNFYRIKHMPSTIAWERFSEPSNLHQVSDSPSESSSPRLSLLLQCLSRVLTVGSRIQILEPKSSAQDLAPELSDSRLSCLNLSLTQHATWRIKVIQHEPQWATVQWHPTAVAGGRGSKHITLHGMAVS